MIQGLKVTVPGPELKELCHLRSEHHTGRAKVYAEQVASMEQAKITAPNNYSGGDPVEALRKKKDEHTNSAKEMEFIAEHIDIKEDYLLERADLAKLGIVKDGYRF